MRVAAALLMLLVACGGPVAPSQPRNAVPRARLAAPLYAPPGEDVVFDAGASYDPDGTLVEYTFVFSDGARALVQSGPEAVHRFAESGAYEVAVIVRDDAGALGRATQLVVVRTDPPPCDGVSDCPLGAECRDSHAPGAEAAARPLCYATGPGSTCPSGACAADCALDTDCGAGFGCRAGLCLPAATPAP